MSRIKGRDTVPELKLRRAIWKLGYRYRISPRKLPGKPDLVFTRAKVAVFIDGAFWHGKKLSPERLSQMSEYWQKKIQLNVKRDSRNQQLLEDMDYLVLRYPEQEVHKNLQNIVDEITRSVTKRRT